MVRSNISPDQSKAVAASHALSGKPPCLLSLYSIPTQALADAKVSTEDIAAIEVIGGSSRVPALIKILKDFFGKEPSRTLNAKECVSRGCALNCAMLSPIFRCVMPIAWLVAGASLSPFGVKAEFILGGSLLVDWHSCSAASVLRSAWYISTCRCTPAVCFCQTGALWASMPTPANSCMLSCGSQLQRAMMPPCTALRVWPAVCLTWATA